ncbi:hypothetical protein TNCT_426621 [Trichonephila clavata]|uniref:Uncharacterized protein n=1 Tax=Trichonephila clavata TaxID=2740835 RepID=A0A8X6ICZ0_TRICU|nr:hypothetical protein TNCT_426621 [Trichonephila clavata]
MFENATKEDLVTVLVGMGETIDADLGIMKLKQKLMLSKAYLEDEEFVRDVLATTIEDRMEKEKIEAARCKAEKEARRREARHKAVIEAKVLEARWRIEEEARLRAEEEDRPKAEEEARLKDQEEARFKAQEERKMNEKIALEEETRLEKERWRVQEQMQQVHEKHKMRMKAEKQKC